MGMIVAWNSAQMFQLLLLFNLLIFEYFVYNHEIVGCFLFHFSMFFLTNYNKKLKLITDFLADYIIFVTLIKNRVTLGHACQSFQYR